MSSLPPKPGPTLLQVHKSSPFETQTGEGIFIPQEARGQLLSSFSLSMRLRNIFAFKEFRLLGELHGLTYDEVSKYRNCGQKTLKELRELVYNVQKGVTAASPAVDDSFSHSASARVEVCIPPYACDFSPSDLPISVRLGNALASMGIRRLGELTGRELKEFREVANCGTRTLA